MVFLCTNRIDAATKNIYCIANDTLHSHCVTGTFAIFGTLSVYGFCDLDILDLDNICTDGVLNRYGTANANRNFRSAVCEQITKQTHIDPFLTSSGCDLIGSSILEFVF